jgi:hypothetical protein
MGKDGRTAARCWEA